MSDNPKYYLGLAFDATMSDGLHCTHCYFGTLSESNRLAVTEIVSSYFSMNGPIELRKVAFTVPALFGPERDVRVLLTPEAAAFEPLRALRQHFTDAGLLGQSSFPFRPHVTCSAHSINKRFTHYVFVREGEIIKSWPIYEPVEELKAVQ